MSFQQQTYPSQIYRNFKAIDAVDYRRIVRYYERHEKSIIQLEFEEYLEVLVSYTRALFEIAEYKKHINMANIVIETSIIQNITYIGTCEIYQSTLFQKAASHYNLKEYDEASHILKELLKMSPDDAYTTMLFKRVKIDNRPSYIRHSRAIAILFFLVSAVMVAVEVLIIRNFFEQYTGFVEWGRNFLFVLGVLFLVGSELLHRWRSVQYVKLQVNEAKLTKQKQPPQYLEV